MGNLFYFLNYSAYLGLGWFATAWGATAELVSGTISTPTCRSAAKFIAIVCKVKFGNIFPVSMFH